MLQYNIECLVNTYDIYNINGLNHRLESQDRVVEKM